MYICKNFKCNKMGRKKKYNTKKDAKKAWRNTPYGRASYLVTNYRKMDELNGFGKDSCNLTSQWIVDNIFSQPCKHCGKTGWQIIGCNRLDNSKPHTIDNVEPCCKECNVELEQPKKAMARIDKITGEILEIYESYMEARRNGYTHADSVAKGKRKQEKGYIFEYI